MNRDDVFHNWYRAGGFHGLLRQPLTSPPSDRPPQDHEADLTSIGQSEGWYEPPREVTRVVLHPWQQAVFWGLRLYIVVMLAVMVVGFVKVATGS
jgi:hypothetical protein